MSTDHQRIAWIAYGSLDQVSGGYIYDRIMVDRLRELGDAVRCISLQRGAEPPVSLADYDVVVGDELCFRELGPLFRAAPQRLRRVLLIHHLSAWELPPGAARASLLALERAAIDAADVCVATSLVTAERLRADGLARDVRVAEPGADRLPPPSKRDPRPSDARVRLLFIGNVSARKRVLALVQSVAGLPSAQVELVLVGAEVESDYAAEVRAAIRDAGNAERVTWLGSLDDAGIAEQLASADALVLPSALEGYGMVLSEALWAGLPIIAARVGAAEQLLSLTGAGISFDPQDHAGLSAAISGFVADGTLRSQLRHAAWLGRDRLPRWRETALALRATLRSR